MLRDQPLLKEPVRGFAAELEARRSGAPLAALCARPRVSVIIPIFNAADALSRCLDSIARAGDDAEVILIDDHSSDPHVTDVCGAFARRWRNARILRNDQNVGFVSTVNRGMREAAPPNDVLLLNSDTLVTPGWLRSLSIAAHLDEATASVCPLSNAAGVYSIPKAYGDADLPPDLTPERCQHVLAFVSQRARPTVVSTSGFCMLIKRRVIDEIGCFDEKLFLRGYGEENDFNERALAAGFVHRVDDSRFVYHVRGLSFGGMRDALKRKNSRILQSLHPDHLERLRAWEDADPLAPVRSAYSALLEWTRRASEEELGWLESGRSIFVGRTPASHPHDIHVEHRADERRVDLFSVAQARVRSLELAECVFELVYRWNAAKLVVDEPDLHDAIAPVAAIFGIPIVTA